MIPRPPKPTLFPYTTLFRSISQQEKPGGIEIEAANGDPSTRRQPGKYRRPAFRIDGRSEEHTSELQSQFHLVCRLLLEKKKWSTISSRCASARLRRRRRSAR